MAHRGFALRPGTPLAERTQYHVAVDVQTRCWNWLGAIDKSTDYGRIFVSGRCGHAHRVSYETFIGPIPDGLQLDHLCRNRGCVNPDHLEAVTAQTNVLRGTSPGAIAQRRTACLNGHDYATHGVMRSGRRLCRTCAMAYSREYQALRRRQRAAQWQARQNKEHAA